MKYEALARAMSELDDELLEDAEHVEKRGSVPWKRLCAAACLALVCAMWMAVPSVRMNGGAVTHTPRSIAGETAVMAMRLHEPVQAALELSLRWETTVRVSAGTLLCGDEEGQSLSLRGTQEVVWVVEEAEAGETYEMTFGRTVLQLAYSERHGGWTICRK